MTPTDLRREHTAGRLSTPAYRIACQEFHQTLLAYVPLLADTDIEAIHLSKQGLRLTTTSGLTFDWDPTHPRCPINEAVNFGTYEPLTGKLLSYAARTYPGCAVDAGANIGWHTLRMAQERRTHVYAFEPLPENIRRLQAHTEYNSLTTAVTLVQQGLSNKIGVFKLFQPHRTGSVGTSLVNLHPDEDNTVLEAPFTTLDAFFQTTQPPQPQVAVLKCDVEGAEQLVLKGAWQTLARSRPVIHCELLRKWAAPFGYHPQDVIDDLAKLDYQTFAVSHSHLRSCPHIDDQTVETNFLFLQPDRHTSLLKAFS